MPKHDGVVSKANPIQLPERPLNSLRLKILSSLSRFRQ